MSRIITSYQELLEALLASSKPTEAYDILQAIGDSSEVEAEQRFGELGYHWRYFGGTESNISTANLGSKPGRSLTERVTNAIDAVLEKRMARHAGPEPTSPMAAAMQWFGRPATTADNGLHAWKEYQTHGYDQLIRVVITAGDSVTAPTVDIVDDGIGISPAKFQDTILSLQRGNKIKKRYLAGAYGQGGSATLAFSEYALVVSRSIDFPERVGFTIVKLMQLPEGYKEDAYVYLAVDGDDGFEVPSFDMAGAELDIYPAIVNNKPKPLGTGSLVRHYGYRLDGLEKTLGPSPGNLYHLLQHMMFDPLLPFRVIDLSRDGSPKDELITGSRNRLMKYTASAADKDREERETEESGTELRHHAPREMVSPSSVEGPTVGVEYWVPLSRKKAGEKVGLRSHSNELFVGRNHPFVGTMNGQNQGELTARILRDIGLPLVARHLVLHVDATQASSQIRRNLFSSTREAFKEGEILNELTRVIVNMLRDDEELFVIERELTEALMKRGASEAGSEVKKEISRLLLGAGFKVTEPGDVLVPAETGDKTVDAPARTGRRPKAAAPPLRTLPWPQVTRFEIVYPDDGLQVPLQDNHSIRIETDADFRFDREKRIAIRSEPEKLEIASKSDLRGGRMHWRVRPTDDATPGDAGEIIATLTRPDGSQIESRIPFTILPARVEPGKTQKGLVPAFNIIPIDLDDESFDQIWDNVEAADRTTVAYKVVAGAEGLNVYYSTGFGPFKEQSEALKRKPGVAASFENHYKIWIGYHAIVQHQQRSAVASLDIDDEQLDKLLEHERAVVAEMQVKQALRMAETQAEAAKAGGAE